MCELTKVDETHESAGEKVLEVKRNPDVQVALENKRMCPKCENVVMMQHFFSVKKQVVVEECPNCGGFWLDVGELARIRSLFASAAEREKATEAYFEEAVGPQLAAMKARSQEELEKRRRIANMFRFVCPSYYIPGKQKWGAF